MDEYSEQVRSSTATLPLETTIPFVKCLAALLESSTIMLSPRFEPTSEPEKEKGRCAR
jgi:hypothetical protein